MATQSFYQDNELTNDEEVARLLAAFDEADRRGPIDTSNAARIVTDPKKAQELIRK